MSDGSLTAQLRARGLRVTSARAQVLGTVQQHEHCIPEQIYQEREHGFRVDVGHVTLSGECASCRAGSQ